MRLPRSFYTRDVITVAEELLGKYFVRKLPDGTILSGMIVEVEAYLGDDPASHAYKGKNVRNASVYKAGGHAYVHTQRHHTLIDIVAGEKDQPSSVLIRALIPEEGAGRMQKHRNRSDTALLANGPGKLCQALAITKAMDGWDLTRPKNELWVEDRGINVPKKRIVRTPRIGIGKGKELLLRFVFLTGGVD